jgi:hypothetical protein
LEVHSQPYLRRCNAALDKSGEIPDGLGVVGSRANVFALFHAKLTTFLSFALLRRVEQKF